MLDIYVRSGLQLGNTYLKHRNVDKYIRGPKSQDKNGSYWHGRFGVGEEKYTENCL